MKEFDIKHLKELTKSKELANYDKELINSAIAEIERLEKIKEKAKELKDIQQYIDWLKEGPNPEIAEWLKELHQLIAEDEEKK